MQVYKTTGLHQTRVKDASIHSDWRCKSSGRHQTSYQYPRIHTAFVRTGRGSSPVTATSSNVPWQSCALPTITPSRPIGDSRRPGTLLSCQARSGISANSIRQTNEMANIVHLPEELVENIASWLGSDDKFSLRLTCRALESKSLHEFASEHFTKKCVQFTTDSLQVLVQISKSRLRKYVREVYGIAALFTSLCVSRSTYGSSGWRPNERQADAYRNYVRDQKSLRRSGDDLAMLVEAFNLLPCLKTVALIDSEDRLPAGTDYRGGRTVPRVTGQYCSRRPGLRCQSFWLTRVGRHQSHQWPALRRVSGYIRRILESP